MASPQGTHQCACLKVVAVAIYVLRIATQNERVIVRCFHWHTVCVEVRDCAAELNVSDQHRQGHELVVRGCLRRLQTQAFQRATCPFHNLTVTCDRLSGHAATLKLIAHL